MMNFNLVIMILYSGPPDTDQVE